MFQEHETTPWKEHPEGNCCDKCFYLEIHDASLRKHVQRYCRILPVPAKLALDTKTYWCGMYKEK